MGNHRESIPNHGEWYRQGETIRTAFVESTIHQVVSRRFAKLQPMHWTLQGAHLLLETRTKVLNNELEETFGDSTRCSGLKLTLREPRGRCCSRG
jgi:hypothetical protein